MVTRTPATSSFGLSRVLASNKWVLYIDLFLVFVSVFQMKDGDVLVMSARAARGMAHQDLTKKWGVAPCVLDGLKVRKRGGVSLWASCYHPCSRRVVVYGFFVQLL